MLASSQVVDDYLSRTNQHDIEGALSLLSEDFELQFWDSDYAMDKEGMASALGWDAGTSGHLEYAIVASNNGEVIIEGHESNDFLNLIGIKSLSFRSRFTVGDQGLIEKQEHHVDWGSVTMEAAIQPLIEWAGKAAPAELNAIYPDGRMIYTEKAARRWVALARKWRESNA